MSESLETAASSAADGKKPKVWTRIADGIFRHRKTKKYRITWMDRGHQRQKNEPADTPIGAMKKFRENKQKIAVDKITGEGGGGSFIKDCARFLRSRRNKEGYLSDRAHLKPWIKLFGRFSRHAITTDKINDAIVKWQSEGGRGGNGYAPREIRHRLNVLTQLFKSRDGANAATPVDAANWPPVPKGKKRTVPDATITAVAESLRQAELNGRLRNGKTRARYLVLSTCGKRPCQMAWAEPEDVLLSDRIWFVKAAKGGEGNPLWLNDEMLAAWTLFAESDAWGDYDESSYAKTLRRHGYPKHIRPYNVRHSTLQTMADVGVDLKLIQQAGDHSSPVTTMASYVKHLLSSSKFAGQSIDGRFSSDAFVARKRQKYDRSDADAAD